MTIATPPALYFLHIPRTAGTVIRYWLWEFFSVDDFCDVHYYSDFALLDPDKAARHGFYSGHFGYRGIERMPTGTKVVTVLRDADDHMRSLKSYSLNKTLHHLAPTGYDSFFAEAAALAGIDYEVARDNRDSNFQTRNLVDHYSWETVAPMTAADLAQATRNLAGMAAIGLTDRLAETALLFCFALGWPPSAIVDNSNASDRHAAQADPQFQSFLTRLAGKNKLDEALVAFARENFDMRLNAMRTALGLPADLDLTSAAGRRSAEDALRQRFLRSEPETDLVSHGAWQVQDALFFEGFASRTYWPERGSYARWAKPEADAVIYLPLAKVGRKLVIEVELNVGAEEHIRPSLQLSINGLPLEAQCSTRDEGDDVYIDTLVAAIPASSLIAAQGWQALGIKCQPMDNTPPFALISITLRGDAGPEALPVFVTALRKIFIIMRAIKSTRFWRKRPPAPELPQRTSLLRTAGRRWALSTRRLLAFRWGREAPLQPRSGK